MSTEDQAARVKQLLSGLSKQYHDTSDLNKCVNLVRQWHHDRNLIEGANDKDQFSN